MPFALCLLAGSLCLMASVGADLPAQALPLAFFGVRSACLGMIFPWINTVIGQWFKRYRGRAVGYKGFGLEIGVNLIFAPIMQLLLDDFGWRIANRLLAIMCVSVAIPTAMFMFHTPEQIGCLPDGDHRAEAAYSALETDDEDASSQSDMDEADHPGSPKAQAQREQQAEDDDAASFTRQEALRTLPVWLLAIDIFFAASIGAGTIQVLKLVLRDNGAMDVSIPLHVMIPNGVAQAFLRKLLFTALIICNRAVTYYQSSEQVHTQSAVNRLARVHTQSAVACDSTD